MLKPFGYVNADYLRNSAEKMRDIKESSYEHLHLAKAKMVLDAGCGPGLDTVAIAACAPEGTEVIGVDIDPDMVSAANAFAKQRGLDATVKHVLADGYDLPFEDHYFGACRAERLFQNVPAAHDASAILNELLRVLKPDGRLVLVDTDFGSASVDYEDIALEREMMHYCATQLRPNGTVARQFYRYFKDTGVQDIRIDVYTRVLTKLSESPFGSFLTDAAVKDGVINKKTAIRWLRTLEERDRNGTFFASLNVYIASGTKS
jgi:ubiquinone/menaquinone biosynthesis C-methylase UbiE